MEIEDIEYFKPSEFVNSFFSIVCAKEGGEKVYNYWGLY
jgi:hypothetical protein